MLNVKSLPITPCTINSTRKLNLQLFQESLIDNNESTVLVDNGNKFELKVSGTYNDFMIFLGQDLVCYTIIVNGNPTIQLANWQLLNLIFGN